MLLIVGVALLGFVSPKPPPRKTISVRLGSSAPPFVQEAPPEANTPPPPPPPPPEPPKPPKEVATKSRKAPAKKKLSDKKIMDGTPTPTPTPAPREIAKATTPPPRTPKETPRETPKPVATPYRPPEKPKTTPDAKPKATPYRPPDKASSPTFSAAADSGGPAASTRDLAIDDSWDLDAAYASRALFLIQQNFRSPYSRPGVSCRVQFKIMRNGEIRDPKLTRSSGAGQLDRSAFTALEATGSLPPLYADYPEPFMLVEVTFDFEQSD